VRESPVPVSEWSPRFRAREVPRCLVTHVWFPPGVVLEPHVHDRSTLAIILEGGFDLTLQSSGGRTFACPAGTILTQPAGERHANHIAAEGAQGVVLQPDTIRGTLPARCLTMLDSVSHFRDGPIAVAARGLARELAAPDDVTSLAIEGLVLEILAEAARLDQLVASPRKAPPGWLTSATDLVHAQFRENLRIDDIAQVAGVHAAHLAAVFRRVHRMPVGNYIRRLRVDWAADRLARTDMPISLIAAEAGFSDQAHLTRWFRRVMGATPAAYRRARRR
jgi:AraC family transcriptional regulator